MKDLCDVMSCFRFLPDVILRAPLFDHSTYHPDRLPEMAGNDYFKIALYLSSPSFYTRLAEKRFDISLLNAKEKLTLLKYYNRISFRCTPFGAFSSFSYLNWGDAADKLKLAGPGRAKLHLVPDQEVVNNIVYALHKSGNYQSVIVNPAVYDVKRAFRFIKTTPQAETGKVVFSLESFEHSPLLKRLLKEICQGRDSVSHLIAFIQQMACCDEDDAVTYFYYLMDAQVLKPGTGISLLISKQPAYTAALHAGGLGDLNAAMAGYRFPKLPPLQSISAAFGQWGQVNDIKMPENIFYANLERPVTGSLDIAYREKISKALTALQILTAPLQHNHLKDFTSQFKARFDKQKVPLLKAIDPETGINYAGLASTAAEDGLLSNLTFKETELRTTVEWTTLHKLLMQKWTQGNACDPIVITDNDLKQLDTTEAKPLPASISVMFRLQRQQLFIEMVSGVSAVGLIGRFTRFNEQIWQAGCSVARAEQQANPSVVFAEINHHADGHIDNINTRRPLYDFEINTNTSAALTPAGRVSLADLALSIVDDQLVLESTKLNKRVVPRLSSAYNYQHSKLSLFRLLCDMQHQNLHTNWQLDPEQLFPGLMFYPRVVYNDVILSLAKWHLTASEIKTLTAGNLDQQHRNLQSMRVSKKFPPVIAISKHDQQLVFNLDKNAECTFLLNCARTCTSLLVNEFLMPDDAVLTDPGGPLINQFVALLVNDQSVYHRLPSVPSAANDCKDRDFYLGSQWIYLKLFCSPGMANELLVKKVLPFVNCVIGREAVAWFFIRYKDPEPHLRLRILTRQQFVGTILTGLELKLSGDFRHQVIKDYHADVYRREVERYGADIMPEVEQVFYASSVLIANYLKRVNAGEDNTGYFNLAFISVYALVKQFLPEPETQQLFLNSMAENFYYEHSDEKELRVGLDQKYRELRPLISNLLNTPGYYSNLRLNKWNTQFIKSANQLLALTSNFSNDRKMQLLADLVHMHVNRLFNDHQRRYELVVYYCLHKHVRSANAVNKAVRV